MTERSEDQDLIEVVIACTNGQIGRDAARGIIADLDAAGFEIIRKSGVGETTLPSKENGNG